MTAPLKVTFAASSAAELLVSLAAMADPDGKEVFAGSAADRRRCPPRLLRRIERFGRFGFLNLLGPARTHSTSTLLRWVEQRTARDVHLAVLGARRRQLRELVDARVLDAVLTASAPARRELATALDSGQTVLRTTPWLLSTPSERVRAELLAVLTEWRAVRLPPGAERALRAELRQEIDRQVAHAPADPQKLIGRVAGGLAYDPPSAPRRLVLLPTPSVRPVVVVVDDVETHVLCYPPEQTDDGPTPRDRLLEITRALGDDTRLRIVELLRSGSRTAGEVAGELGAPRTSLLHHLAILRAAGAITTSVGATGTTRYAWRSDVVDELTAAAAQLR
jgi:DNA-binding transcriptional ArsR family regulator